VSTRQRPSYTRATFSMASSSTLVPLRPCVHTEGGSHSSPCSLSTLRSFWAMTVLSPLWAPAASKSRCLQRENGSNLCYKTSFMFWTSMAAYSQSLTSHSMVLKSISSGKTVIFIISRSLLSSKVGFTMICM
jgi:hypothetical protein